VVARQAKGGDFFHVSDSVFHVWHLRPRFSTCVLPHVKVMLETTCDDVLHVIELCFSRVRCFHMPMY
jgi:hypothetical protein